MFEETYHMLAAREETYWWHRARRKMSFALLQRHGVGPGCKWLDIGCGPGGNLKLLDPLHPDLIVGLDLSPIALGLAGAKKADARLVRADVNRALPFADDAFDVVTIFNVLYHDWVVDEVAVVKEVSRVLRRGGLALITEPAFRSLAREMDRATMGHRRYRRQELAAWCRGAGLEVEALSYFTSFGFLILQATKFLSGFGRGTSDEPSSVDMKPLSASTNGLLYRLAALEAGAIAARVPMPFGTTIVAVAKK